MATGRRVGVGVSLVLGLAVAGLLARGGCQSPPAGDVVPTAAAPSAPPPPVTPPPPPVEEPPEITTFAVAGGSRVTLRAGRGPAASFGEIEGALRLDGAEIQGGSFDLTLVTRSVTTPDDAATARLLSEDFLEADRHRAVTFVSTRIAARDGSRYEITGNLTLHGVLKSITFDATITVEGDAMELSASFPVDRRHYGIARAGEPDDPLPAEAIIGLELKLTTQRP
jgi:polyisoprenoid-binding protein YceI